MAYNNNNNTGESPAKFLNALFGGARRRREQRAANKQHEHWMEKWENQKMTNPYAGVTNPYAELENVYEDQTVNLKQAEFEKEQSQQSMANIMQGLQGAAGGSGVAGLAQVLANQGVKQAQQASVSIGEQEQANELRARAEAGRLQQLDVEGAQKADLMEREGARMVEQFEMEKLGKQLGFARERKGTADAAIDAARAAQDQMVTGAVQAMAMASDIRLKENITHTGYSKSGIPTYTFNYKGDGELWSGTMAQDLLELGRENAVSVMDNGYYGVHYDLIDVDMVIKN